MKVQEVAAMGSVEPQTTSHLSASDIRKHSLVLSSGDPHVEGADGGHLRLLRNKEDPHWVRICFRDTEAMMETAGKLCHRVGGSGFSHLWSLPPWHRYLT